MDKNSHLVPPHQVCCALGNHQLLCPCYQDNNRFNGKLQLGDRRADTALGARKIDHSQVIITFGQGDVDVAQPMSIIDELRERYVCMANFACVGGHAINGVAELHTRLLIFYYRRDYGLSRLESLWSKQGRPARLYAQCCIGMCA